MKLAYGTYGLPGLELSTAVKAIADTGFAGIELAAGPGYLVPGEFTAADRARLRDTIAEHRLELAAVMPFISAWADPEQHHKNIETLGEVFALWHDVSPNSPPIATFNMGGESWERDRAQLVANLVEMGTVARAAGGIVAVKAHYGTMVRTPEQARWVLQAVNHPQVRLNYDLSHFSLAGFDLEQSLGPLLPWVAHVHVKDSEFDSAGQFRFLLPGKGKTHYAEYFSALIGHGVATWACAEVSAMVFRAPGYDWREAMQFCSRVLREGLGSAMKESL